VNWRFSSQVKLRARDSGGRQRRHYDLKETVQSTHHLKPVYRPTGAFRVCEASVVMLFEIL
jgi:hypothetical protein